jgi:hypothetical protein
MVLLTFALVSFLAWVLLRLRRPRHSPQSSSVTDENKMEWSLVVCGACFAGAGLDMALRGKAHVDVGYVSGANVQIGGALLCMLGIVLAVRAFVKK